VDVRFLGQPFPGALQIGTAFADALDAHPGGRVWIATAWAKRSGLGRLATQIRTFKDSGGRIRAIIGVDEGGASVEGLRLALDLFDEPYVFYDPGARTFHPKLYLARNADSRSATAIIGSGNATKGGLFSNYEAAVIAHLDLTNTKDEAFWGEMTEYFGMLLADATTVRRLTSDFLPQLEADPAIRVGSERSANAARILGRALRPDRDSLFGPARTGLSSAPPAGTFAVSADEEDDDALGPALEHEIEADAAERFAATEAMDEPAAVDIGPGFFKRLSKFDASPSSAPGQIIIPIRFRPFFPDLAVEKDETANGGVRQSASEFPVTFIQEQWAHPANARVILYEPASDHPRPNPELRFTFRSIAIRDSLKPGDVLIFRATSSGVVVEWAPPGSKGGAQFGVLTEE
jgi:hypothetical protein